MRHILPPLHTLAEQLTQVANELRALGILGRHYAENPYQIERNDKVLEFAARLLSLVETGNVPELEHILLDDVTAIAPLAVVDTAVFDNNDRLLLIQRTDDQLWAMPGGRCEVNESPAAGGAREVWEQSGYTVEITQLIGVFDSRYSGTLTSRHLYHLLFAARVLGGEAMPGREILDVRWFATNQIPWNALSPGYEKRIRFALMWRADMQTSAYFDREI